MLTMAIHWGMAAIAPLFKAAGAPAVAAIAASHDSDFVFYELDVAFTPYGPEILSYWMPVTIASESLSELKRGDLA